MDGEYKLVYKLHHFMIDNNFDYSLKRRTIIQTVESCPLSQIGQRTLKTHNITMK